MLLIAKTIYVTPALAAVNYGIGYKALSIAPFNLEAENPLRLRILTPTLAYLCFLGGDAYIVVPLTTGLLFLASIYVYFRR